MGRECDVMGTGQNPPPDKTPSDQNPPQATKKPSGQYPPPAKIPSGQNPPQKKNSSSGKKKSCQPPSSP